MLHESDRLDNPLACRSRAVGSITCPTSDSVLRGTYHGSMPKSRSATDKTRTKSQRSKLDSENAAPSAHAKQANRQMPVKSAQTRRRVLDAAAKILAAKGFAGTRLSDIADEAELRAPAIYYYFRSREDLVEEVMWVGNKGTREYVVKTLDALDPATSPLDRILVAVKAHLEHILGISDYAKAATRNGLQLPQGMRARQIAEQAEYSRIWRGLLADAADAGQLREGLDPYAARMLIIGALNWAPEWWDIKRGSLESLIHSAQDLVRHALACPNGSELQLALSDRRQAAS